MIKISEIDAIVLRFPLENPVQTSFGLMLDRPMLIVKLTTDEGIIGWGEVWCNFPNAGAEHSTNLINQVFKPVILKNEFLDQDQPLTF